MERQAFSGGASGADKAWEAEAKRIGLPLSFTHYRPEDIARVSPENQQVLRKATFEAAKALGKLWPTNSLAMVQRNYLIARACDKLWAIAPMRMHPHNGTAEAPFGGTGWTVQYAIDLGKEVVFFDQLKEVWWYWHIPFATWMPLEAIEDWESHLILSAKPGLVGARHLSKAGLAAIQQVLTNTKEKCR